MPNVRTYPPAPEARALVRDRIEEALKKGRGVAVVTMRDLLPAPADEDHLVGDEVEAAPVIRDVAFMLGGAGVTYWPDLAPSADAPVILVRDKYQREHPTHPVGALFDSMRSLRVALPSEHMARAEDVASIVRSLSGRRPKTRTT